MSALGNKKKGYPLLHLPVNQKKKAKKTQKALITDNQGKSILSSSFR